MSLPQAFQVLESSSWFSNRSTSSSSSPALLRQRRPAPASPRAPAHLEHGRTVSTTLAAIHAISVAAAATRCQQCTRRPQLCSRTWVVEPGRRRFRWSAKGTARGWQPRRRACLCVCQTKPPSSRVKAQQNSLALCSKPSVQLHVNTQNLMKKTKKPIAAVDLKKLADVVGLGAAVAAAIDDVSPSARPLPTSWTRCFTVRNY